MRCLRAIRGATIIKTREDEKRRHKKGGRAEGENTRRVKLREENLWGEQVCEMGNGAQGPRGQGREDDRKK